MSPKVPAQSHAVNRPKADARLWQQQLWLWSGGSLLVALLMVSGLDAWLANATYQPNLHTSLGWAAWQLREWGAAIPGYVAVLALLVLFVPLVARQYPLIYRAAAALVITAVLGAGLINQVLLQELTDRHRPRETVLQNISAEQLPATLQGHSFPSGHAGIAFALLAPALVVRRNPRTRRLGTGLLVGAAAYGTVVGIARLVQGAHYASDVLAATVISLAVALLAEAWLARGQTIPRRLLLGVIILAGAGVLLGNAFRVTLAHTFAGPLPHIALPCPVTARPLPNISQPTLVVEVQGYGAPVSNVRLHRTSATLSLATWPGVFHSLHCTATLQVPRSE